MSKFIENVNAYLSHNKIKKTFISLKSGIDKDKLSLILDNNQDVNSTDMEKIAIALGKNVEDFLLEDNSVVEVQEGVLTTSIISKKETVKIKKEIVQQVISLIENADEIVGAKSRYMMNIE